MLERLLKEEDGQTTTEYVLILAVVVTIFMQFRKHMIRIVTNLLKEIGDKTGEAVCSGEDC
jgi:Flp pilus assembly pilin Flp